MRLTPFTFAVLLTLSTLLLCESTDKEGNIALIFTVLAAASVAAALFVANRYMLYRYIYVLSEHSIKVYRIRGNTSTMLANIGLYECLALTKKADGFGVGGRYRRYDHTQNLFPKNVRFLYFESAGEKGVMRLEASDEFYSMLLKLMPSKEV